MANAFYPREGFYFSQMRCQTFLSTQLQDPVPPTKTADPASQAPPALLPSQTIPPLLSIAPDSPELAPRAIQTRYSDSRSDNFSSKV